MYACTGIVHTGNRNGFCSNGNTEDVLLNTKIEWHSLFCNRRSVCNKRCTDENRVKQIQFTIQFDSDSSEDDDDDELLFDDDDYIERDGGYILDQVNKNKRKKSEQQSKASGSCYPAALITEACENHSYALSIVQADGLDIASKQIKSITQLNANNQIYGSLMIEQHINDQNLDNKSANYLCRVWNKWALRMGPLKAIHTIMNILRKQQYASHPVKELKKIDKQVDGAFDAATPDQYIIPKNTCYNKILFGNECKKTCTKNHNCPECGDTHKLEDCKLVSEKVRQRLRTANYRWKNNSNRGGYRGGYNRYRGGYNRYGYGGNQGGFYGGNHHNNNNGPNNNNNNRGNKN